MEKVTIENAIGMTIGYDITEVDPINHVKRRAFKRGDILRHEDIDHLHRLGRHTIYVIGGDGSEVHEDDAATALAPLIAGENISFDPTPTEGKICFYSDCSGIFSVDRIRLEQINGLAIPSLPTIHDGFPVEKGKQVATFRIIPITCERPLVDKMITLLQTPLISIIPYVVKKGAILVTGSEVFSGRIEDGFTPKLTTKLQRYGIDITCKEVLPDRRQQISQAVLNAAKKAEIILITGGTSVDPDDVTVAAMADAGVRFPQHGNPIQPGNNLTIGYLEGIPVVAVPAAALFYKATALDIFLPKLLCGKIISPDEICRSGHGGLCHFCHSCVFPVCPFGRGL